MHPYSINTDERTKIFFVLSVVSILSAWAFYKILGFFRIDLSWWIESPSVLGFYGLFCAAFDKWLWKPAHKKRLLKTPDLSGEWYGHLKTSYDEFSSEIKATLQIIQTWTHIKVILKTDHSSSFSEAASLVLDQPEGAYLSYQYLNEPRATAKETMHIHRGTAILVFNEKEKILTGEYYSGRDRGKFGWLEFKFKNKVRQE